MAVTQQWADKNRPKNNLDYQRIVDAVQIIEREIKSSDPVTSMNRRFDYDTGLRFGVRRTEDTYNGTRTGIDGERALITSLCSAWVEGFAFGSLVHSRYGRGRQAETFADQIALVDVNHLLRNSDQVEIDRIFLEIVSKDAINFVGAMRSNNAYITMKPLLAAGERSRVRELLAAHWFDGFSVGLVFQELGGHRV